MTESNEILKEDTDKIILPGRGIIKDKDGNTVYGYLPYKFSFISKEDYLSWVRIWKSTYKTLSQEIREEKSKRNLAFKNNDIPVGSAASYQCHTLKSQATALLQIRKEGKTLSWSMRKEAISHV